MYIIESLSNVDPTLEDVDDDEMELEPRREEIKAHPPPLPTRNSDDNNELSGASADELKSQILNHIGDNRISQLISFMLDSVSSR